MIEAEAMGEALWETLSLCHSEESEARRRIFNIRSFASLRMTIVPMFTH